MGVNLKRSPVAGLLFVFLLLVVLLAPRDAATAGPSLRNVLLLTSYHQGDRWNDSVVQGVREALGPLESVRLSIENLDMRRNTDQDHARLTKEYIRAKYQSRPQDLVLVSDDPALNFLLSVREDLFPNAPIVFCGVNNFTPSRIQGQTNITGVNETLSLEATLELALKLFPQTTRILAVVSDTDASGRSNLELYRTLAARMKGRVHFDELLNMTDKDAPGILSHLSKDSLILRLTTLLNPEGGYLSIEEGSRILAAYAPVPVFTAWSFDLGDCALGGYVSSGQDQGRMAGNLAIRILEGQGADQIPVVMESPNVPMFDYKLMERFGIKESALPKGSVVLNRQVQVWEQYWGLLLGIALFCGLQTVLIVSLLHHRRLSRKATAALTESENNHKLVLSMMQESLSVIDSDGNFLLANFTAARHLTGGVPENLIGKNIRQLVPEEQSRKLLAAYRQVLDSGVRSVQEVLVTLRQEDRWFYNTLQPLEYGEQKIKSLLSISLDITERKLAEEELSASREILKAVLDTIPVRVFWKDRDLKYLGCNAPFARDAGLEKPEDLVGKDDYAMGWRDQAELYRADDRAVIDSGTPRLLIEEPQTTPSGETIHLLTSKVPLRNADGTNGGVLGTYIDITDRKQAEERIKESEARLRESEHHFRTLANSGLALIWTSGPDKLCNSFNETWLRYTGRTLEQELGNGWAEGVHPDDYDRCLDIYVSHFDRREPFSMEYRLRKANGEYGWIFDLGNPRYDSEDKFAGYIGFCYDITDRKRAEEEKKILNTQLQQAQKLEAIGTLAGGIAHDFNNILGAIVGYSEIIRDDLPPESPSIHDINQVINASHRAKDLVKQILAFSRQVEDQKIPMQPAVIVKEAITLLRSSLPTTITIKQDIDADAGMVLADPTQIHQIVMNLATNAFHAMEAKGGMLAISLQKKILSQDDLATEPDLQPGTFVQLSIKDTGEGIAPEIRDRIFDPFFTTKEVGKGTGLGLSMVYSIVKSCHGAIACDSRLGEGTEFRILLPVLEGHSLQEENGSTNLIPHGKEHILFIDDEEMLAELGQVMLKRLGYHVTTRRNSLDAFTTFQNQPDTFDLIITDQTMPGMTGVDLARRILQIRPEMPIILCTGYSSLISEDKVKAAGIRGFAYKPLAKKEIGELIRKVLDGKNH